MLCTCDALFSTLGCLSAIGEVALEPFSRSRRDCSAAGSLVVLIIIKLKVVFACDSEWSCHGHRSSAAAWSCSPAWAHHMDTSKQSDNSPSITAHG